jgi:signal transduction histidine kinase
MGFERHHSAWILASVITVASFVGATAYSQNRLARLDTLSSLLEKDALPSIQYLSRVDVGLARLNQLMDEVTASGSRRDAALPLTRMEIASLHEDLHQYSQLKPLNGEEVLQMKLRTEVDRASQLIDATINEAREGESRRVPPAASDLDNAIDDAEGAAAAVLNFDVQQAEKMAADVADVRTDTLGTIVKLDALATVIALGAVLVAFRATRRHDRLVHEHSALLAARVTELDRFAGRVAHDILSPLGAIAAGLSLLARSADERGHLYIERSQHAVHRVQQLVDGLLTFARSGAHPGPSSGCSMDAVLTNVVAGCTEPAEEKGIELVVDVQQRARVSCAPGVVTSIGENLVLNAIKYMGTQPTRRIVVRTTAAGDVARLEVEDSGPGVPPDIRTTLFEPFVRGPHEHVNGTGLGLATVKRLVESHGGKVGVESRMGAGSLFWVELPLVRGQIEESAVSNEPQHV